MHWKRTSPVEYGPELHVFGCPKFVMLITANDKNEVECPHCQSVRSMPVKTR